MKFTNILSVGVIALVACSFLPTAAAAAVDIVKRDAASDAKAILDGATADIAPIKTSECWLPSTKTLQSIRVANAPRTLQNCWLPTRAEILTMKPT